MIKFNKKSYRKVIILTLSILFSSMVFFTISYSVRADSYQGHIKGEARWISNKIGGYQYIPYPPFVIPIYYSETEIRLRIEADKYLDSRFQIPYMKNLEFYTYYQDKDTGDEWIWQVEHYQKGGTPYGSGKWLDAELEIYGRIINKNNLPNNERFKFRIKLDLDDILTYSLQSLEGSLGYGWSHTKQEVSPTSLGSVPPQYTSEILDWGTDAIDAEKVWGGYENSLNIWSGNPTGQGVKALLIDTGIDINHPDLVDNYKGGWDADEGDSTPQYNSSWAKYYHGTHCSGIIGASENFEGMIGVAPEADIYMYKNDLISTMLQNVANGIQWGIDHGVDVISISAGETHSQTTSIDRSTAQTKINAAHNAGIIIVAAGGNGGEDQIGDDEPVYPGAFEHVICVGSISSSYYKSSFSNYGDHIDLVAPGEDIFSTFPDDTYDDLSGTSMSCPMVAGVVALMLSIDSGLTPTEIENLLKNTANKNIIPNYNQHPEYYGAGMVDAYSACNAV